MVPHFTLNKGRGVNPGDTLAQRRIWNNGVQTLNKGRGVNPGDTRAPAAMPARFETLNKGRGVNPGDTTIIRDLKGKKRRSTKAGA